MNSKIIIHKIISHVRATFEEDKENVDKYMKEAVEWYKTMDAKTIKEGTTKSKKEQASRAVTRKRAQAIKKEKVSVNSVTSSVDGGLDFNESVSRRTRAAVKALRESTMCNATYQLDGCGRRLRRTTTRTSDNADGSGGARKRSAEEEKTPRRATLRKRIKQEQLSVVESSTSSPVQQQEQQQAAQEEVFKKPRPRRRVKEQKTKKKRISPSTKNLCSETLEDESQFFRAAVVHSSPNPGFEAKMKDVSVPSPPAVGSSVKDKVAAFESLGSKAKSSVVPRTGNTVSHDPEPEHEETQKEVTVEEVGKEIEKEESAAANAEPKIQIPTIRVEEVTCSTDAQIATSGGDATKVLDRPKSTDSTVEFTDNREATAAAAAAAATTTMITVVPSSGDEEVQSAGEETTTKNDKKGSKSGSRRGTRNAGSNGSGTSAKTANEDLNVTKVVTVPAAMKRTKPVLKSKVFDNEGNIMLKVKEKEGSVEEEVAGDAPYSLRSSSRSTSSKESQTVKEEKKKKKKKSPSSSSSSSAKRRSNAENEPVSGEARRLKTMKRESLEVIDSSAEAPRFTRSKAKQAKLQQILPPKSNVALLARKSVKKAVRVSLLQDEVKKFQGFAAGITPRHIQGHILAKQYSSSKKRELLATTGKMKPPLSVVTNTKLGLVNMPSSHSKIPNLLSGMKGNNEHALSATKGKYPVVTVDIPNLITPAKLIGTPAEEVWKSGTKHPVQDEAEKKQKLKTIQEKQEEAEVKRLEALKNRQEELKRKNEMKLKSAMKQRKKLEAEKHMNILQSEKEKEEKRRLLLEERDNKLREQAMRKKLIMEQKMAEIEEKRKAEEEARLAKLKELEAEQERQMLEKQKELERQEKIAQDRIAEQKAREAYEQQLRQEQMKMEKVLAAKKAAQAAAAAESQPQGSKQAPTKKVWNYEARNEDDFGLEEENSDEGSDCDDPESEKPLPAWARRVFERSYATGKFQNRDMISTYMQCYQKTPDINKMFNMTPRKRLKRTSSAIWDTPSRDMP